MPVTVPQTQLVAAEPALVTVWTVEARHTALRRRHRPPRPCRIASSACSHCSHPPTLTAACCGAVAQSHGYCDCTGTAVPTPSMECWSPRTFAVCLQAPSRLTARLQLGRSPLALGAWMLAVQRVQGLCAPTLPQLWRAPPTLTHAAASVVVPLFGQTLRRSCPSVLRLSLLAWTLTGWRSCAGGLGTRRRGRGPGGGAVGQPLALARAMRAGKPRSTRGHGGCGRTAKPRHQPRPPLRACTGMCSLSSSTSGVSERESAGEARQRWRPLRRLQLQIGCSWGAPVRRRGWWRTAGLPPCLWRRDRRSRLLVEWREARTQHPLSSRPPMQPTVILPALRRRRRCHRRVSLEGGTGAPAHLATRPALVSREEVPPALCLASGTALGALGATRSAAARPVLLRRRTGAHPGLMVTSEGIRRRSTLTRGCCR